MRRFIARLINVFRPERAEADLEREIAAHLTLLEDEYRRRGMSEDDARVASRRALGGASRTQDLHRDARSFIWLDDLRRDFAHAARSLKRNPGFTVVAVLTLALGIGASTAIFSVISAVLLRPLPYPDADRLVSVYVMYGDDPVFGGVQRGMLRPWSFDTLRQRTRALTDASGYIATTATLTGQGDAVRLTGVLASASLFHLLGVPPLVGRSFTAAEEAEGADAVVVLSASAWQRYFNRDAGVIGRAIALDGRARTVVGVMPDTFAFPDSTVQFWEPFVIAARDARNYISPAILARMPRGISREVAEADVHEALRDEKEADDRIELRGLQDGMVAPVKPALLVLVGAVALVLLIACVNVANLLLVRTAAREIELAVRRAMGASPWRLVRQMLTESTLIALLGAIAGAALAYGGVRLLRSLAAILPRRDLGTDISLPRLAEIGIDGTVLLFAIGLALVTGLACGLLPSLQHSRSPHLDVLRQRGTSPRMRGALVVAEIAMAIVLLVGGGLLIRSFVSLANADRGYDAERVITFQVSSQPTAGPQAFVQAKALADDVVERIAALPGVIDVGYANNLPLVQQGFSRDVSPRPPTRGQPPRRPQPGMHAVSPRFPQAMGMRLIGGRGFSTGEAARHEALITRVFARSSFFDRSALGAHIYTDNDDWEVVGILEDVKQFSLQQRPTPELFIIDFAPPPPGLGGAYVAVRTSSDPSVMAAHARAIVRQLDPAVAVDNVATMDQIVSNAMAQPRLYAVLLGIFAAVAVALAAVGIYGVLAFVVTQRTREIGIRVALGARQSQVIALILRNTVWLAAIGMVAGVAGASALSRYLEGLLFGVTPLDPATFIAVVAMFIAIAAMASYVPARRATRIEPQVALRAE
jgi:predicted permease